jgi:hypothetical protein
VVEFHEILCGFYAVKCHPNVSVQFPAVDINNIAEAQNSEVQATVLTHKSVTLEWCIGILRNVPLLKKIIFLFVKWEVTA